MTDNATDDFFTADHSRLANIADLAKWFAWIAFVINVLLVGAKYIEVHNLHATQAFQMQQEPDFGGMLIQNPLYAISIFVDMISIFVRGVVYWLVLKGISLGLYMIIEIDLDNKEKSQGENNG